MEWVIANWADIATVLGAVILAAHVVTELTPTPRDDQFFAKVYKLLQVAGLKFGKSRNKV